MNEKDMLHQFDHAKLGRFHFILVILSGLCWALVAYGVTIIGFLLPSLRADWGTSSSLLGIIAGASLVGMFIGSTIGGTLADRLGRRRVLTWALVFSGAFFLLLRAILELCFSTGTASFHWNGSWCGHSHCLHPGD
jgi:MFS family permease